MLRKSAAVIRGKDDLLVHANHLEAPEFAGYETAPENSCHRRQRLEALLDGAPAPLTVSDLQEFYRDHGNAPHSLCAHPFAGRNVQTVASLIGDLTSLELHLAKGSPCQSAYATYTLATCRHGSVSVEVRDRFLETRGRIAPHRATSRALGRREASRRRRHSSRTASTSRGARLVGGPSATIRFARTISALIAVTRWRTSSSLRRLPDLLEGAAHLGPDLERRRKDRDLLPLEELLDPPVRIVRGVESGNRLALALEIVEGAFGPGLVDQLFDPRIPALPGRLVLCHCTPIVAPARIE